MELEYFRQNYYGDRDNEDRSNMSDGIGPEACQAELKVRAQPMVKDEQAELWKPLTVNHIDPRSMVTVEKRQGQHVIVAYRIADSKEILCCPITTDIKYHAVSTSFHHWSTAGGAHLNGLTFDSCSAANKFHQHVSNIIRSVDGTPDDINSESSDGQRGAGESNSSPKVPTVPPKRPEKPQSLASVDVIPPETPPPRLPHRTHTPPVPGRTSAAVSHTSRMCKSASPTLSNMENMGRQQLSPELPPRPNSNQIASCSKTHTVHRAVPITTGSSHRHAALAHLASQAPRGQRQGAGSYNDYREYELKPPAKTQPVSKSPRGSTSSSVSSMSTDDSLTSDDRSIRLPTKGRRSQDSSCCYAKAKTRDTGKKLLCRVCNEYFYECDNVRGACSAPQGLVGSGLTSSKRSRRRTFTRLLRNLLSCSWCYKSCRCSRNRRRHGAKHEAVRGKSDPS